MRGIVIVVKPAVTEVRRIIVARRVIAERIVIVVRTVKIEEVVRIARAEAVAVIDKRKVSIEGIAAEAVQVVV